VAIRKGRVEAALDRELRDHPEVTGGERAMLRAQARAVDVAEGLQNPDLVSGATHGYLEVRKAVGITGGPVTANDPFDQLLRELAQPRMGDPAQP
jgi:hypothetical protein